MVDARFPVFLVQRTGPCFPVEYMRLQAFHSIVEKIGAIVSWTWTISWNLDQFPPIKLFFGI